MIYLYEVDLRKLSPELLGLDTLPKLNLDDTIILTGKVHSNLIQESKEVSVDYNVNKYIKWTPKVCKKFIFNTTNNVPSNCLADVTKLRNFIMQEMHIDISLFDTYLLWDSISESFNVHWLDIDYQPYIGTKEEFLLHAMEKRGFIKE